MAEAARPTSQGPADDPPVRPPIMVDNASNLLGIVVIPSAPMQQIYAAGRAFFVSAKLLPIIITPFLVAAGCIERPTTIDTPPDRPHAGVVLTAAASDPADREILRLQGSHLGSACVCPRAGNLR